jgi:hypothetical protein
MSGTEVLICLASGEMLLPQKVWESRLPNGRPIRYGQFARHFHVGQECEWSYLVQPVREWKIGFSFF